MNIDAVDAWTETIPMRRWTPNRWALTADGNSVAVTSPVAYSGNTGPDGVTGPLAREPMAGAIGVVVVPVAKMQSGLFDALDWDAPAQPVHPDDYDPQTPYERVNFSQDLMRDALARFAAAGSAGLVLVIDLPADHITSGYLLYDGVHRELPALFVSREQAPGLLAAADAGVKATLVLDATVDTVETANLLGLIRGGSDELVVLHSHTDGPNGLEDNGPEAIMAMATYLAARPAADLPRSVLVLLSTGHFAIEEAWGVEAFLARHADTLVPRIAAVLSLEHLGALASRIDRERGIPATEPELGAVFTTPHRVVIDSMRRAQQRASLTAGRVLRPFVPDTTGHSPDGLSWPGDGCPFWHTAGLPAANFIAGPDYLFNVEPVLPFIDVGLLRRQAIAFTEAALELSALPWDELHRRIDTGTGAKNQANDPSARHPGP